MKRKSLQLTLFLTNSCNLNCIYCYELKKNKGVMSYETAIKWIEYCLDNSENEYVSIYLFGGEPLLQFPLVKRICEWTWSNVWNVKYSFTLQTNGTLLDEHMKEWFTTNKNLISLCLSLDGTRDTHNKNRCGSFDRIDLSFFKETWPKQPVKMTINYENIKNLKNDVVWIQENGFRIRGCNFAIGQSQFTDETFKIIREQLRLLADYYIEHQYLEIAPILKLPLYLLSQKKEKRRLNCKIGTDELIVINTNGTRSPCTYFSNISFDTDEYKKLENEVWNLSHEKIQCYNQCDFFTICDMCYGENFSETGNFFIAPKNKCKLMKIRIAASMYLMSRWIIKKGNFTNEDILTLDVITKYYSKI